MQAILALGYENAFPGQRDPRIRTIRDIGEKYSVPNCATLSAVHVLHVKHNLRKAFIKYAGLHFKRNLRALKLFLQVPQRRQRPRSYVKRIPQSEQPGGGDKNRQHAAKAPHPHAAGTHGGDFAVGGQAAQPDQDSHQHAHGQGVGQRKGNSEREDFGDAGKRSAVPHHSFQNPRELAHKDDEGEH